MKRTARTLITVALMICAFLIATIILARADYATWESWLGISAHAAPTEAACDEAPKSKDCLEWRKKCPAGCTTHAEDAHDEVCDIKPEECKPSPVIPSWRPWRQVWQCNDIRLTVASRTQGLIEYDIGGTIWVGSRFAVDFRRNPDGTYWFNGRPCARLQ